MLKTVLPYENIDYEAYAERYFAEPEAMTELPDKEECAELARKNIVKGHIVLADLPQEEPVQAGDTVSFSCESTAAKYNKPKITVSVGRGLFDRDVEEQLIGRRAGDVIETSVNRVPVRVQILRVQRKQVPEPTDEMTAQMCVKDMQQQPVKTVAGYEKMIYQQKRVEVLSTVNYYITEPLFRDYPVEDCAEEDILALGVLEERMFYETFLRDEGIDLYKESKDAMQERWGCDSFRDFIAMRRDWYKIKIQQCLIYGRILGIPLQGEMDPTGRYEVLSDLILKMFDKTEEMMRRRVS